MNASTTINILDSLKAIAPDEETARKLVKEIDEAIKEETKIQTTETIKDFRVEVIREIKDSEARTSEKIYKAKLETVLWIVGVGVLQVVLKYLTA